MSLILFIFCFFYVAQTQRYDPHEAQTALYYAYGAYCNASKLIQWSCKWCDYVHNFTIARDGVIIGDTLQAYVGYDSYLERIVVSFGGMDQNVEDWIDTLDVAQTHYPLPESYLASESYIHTGFLGAWKDMMVLGLNSSLQSILADYPHSAILLTGHSTSAAVAQIAALELKRSHSVGAIHIITFGSPRWCTKSVANYFDDIMNSSWRIVNKNDIVPSIPYMKMGDYGYYHTSTQIHYTGNDSYTKCNGTAEGESCGHIGYSVSDHMSYFGLYRDCECDTPTFTPTKEEKDMDEIEIIYKFKKAASQGLNKTSKIALAITLIIGYLVSIMLCCCLIKTRKELQQARRRGAYFQLENI
eukprot:706020_1